MYVVEELQVHCHVMSPSAPLMPGMVIRVIDGCTPTAVDPATDEGVVVVPLTELALFSVICAFIGITVLPLD